MLDHQSRKILSSFHALDCKEEDFCDAFFDSEDIASHSGIDEKDVERCFLHLYGEGYLIPRADENGHVCEYALSQRGKFHREFERISRIDFFKKSVLCPILVAVLTTLLTLLLSAHSTPAAQSVSSVDTTLTTHAVP